MIISTEYADCYMVVSLLIKKQFSYRIALLFLPKGKMYKKIFNVFQWLRHLLLISFLMPVVAMAQSYPQKNVRIVAPFPPGTGTELIARELAHQFSKVFDQSFYVENKPGAGGLIGTQFVKNAKPDGYTLLVAGAGPLAINPALYTDVPYDPATDFKPVGMIATVPNALVVRSDFPGDTVEDVIRHVKENPDTLNYASSGSGVPSHLMMELFKDMAGLDLMHIPYQGSAATLNALLSGQVDLMFETVAAALPHVKNGDLKVIATAGGERTPSMPDVPTIAESGLPEFSAQGWSVLAAPADTPVDILEKLNREM